MLALHPPVEAPIVRPFDYAGSPFAAGLHRGIDFGAAPGTPVAAPCAGRVAFAGPSPEGGAVTLACAGRRVTLLPLAGVRVQRRMRVGAGAPLGAVAPGGHDGLHLGLRDAGNPLGYRDPAAYLTDAAAPPLGAPPPPGRRGPRRTAPPSSTRPPSPASASAPSPASSAPLAPWPAWLGAALALLGTFGAGRRSARRPARRTPSMDPAAAEAP